jgi:hypothetical protein
MATVYGFIRSKTTGKPIATTVVFLSLDVSLINGDLVFDSQNSAPTNPSNGRFEIALAAGYYTVNVLGRAWRILVPNDTASHLFSDLIVTDLLLGRGELLTGAGATGVVARLPAGSDGQALLARPNIDTGLGLQWVNGMARTIASNATAVNTTMANIYLDLMVLTIPAGTFATDGDAMIIRGVIDTLAGGGTTVNLTLVIDSTTVMTSGSTSGIDIFLFEVHLYRLSSITLRMDAIIKSLSGLHDQSISALVVLNASLPNVVKWQGATTNTVSPSISVQQKFANAVLFPAA